MTFWRNALLGDPKRKNKWVVTIPATTGYLAIPEFVVAKISKPQLSIKPIEHKFLGYTFKYPGNGTWNDITLEVVDPGGREHDIAYALLQRVRGSGYQIPKTDSKFITTSKKEAVLIMNNVEIKQIDAESKPIETWTLQNAWISDVNFGDLDYEADELSRIIVQLTYDFANLKDAGPKDIEF
jgi:hypothetical protein